MYILPSCKKPEAAEGGNVFIGGWPQLTRKKWSALVGGLPQSTG